jgi:UDP-3-O-[3-hydroxymyristoyl] glucosamine N-acyltransferase
MSNSLNLAELASKFDFILYGNESFVIEGLAPLAIATNQQLSFLVNPIYRAQAITSDAGALILNEADYQFVSSQSGKNRNYLVAKNPYALFARIAQEHQNLTQHDESGSIHPTAVIEPGASIASSAVIGPFCTVKSGAQIGEKVKLEGHVHIGKNVSIGSFTKIFPMTVIYDECQVGQRCIIHGGVVIGSDGFGFAPDFSATGGEWVKIPQTGRVIIGNDVEMGASMTVDRGAMADTVIGNGCKFDNQVQIGHNVKLGDHCVMAGCSGVAGSTELGNLCIIGGYSNFSGHLQIADRTTVSGGTSITKSITTPGQHFTGVFPFTQHAQWEKNAAILRGLDKLRQQVKKLIQG